MSAGIKLTYKSSVLLSESLSSSKCNCSVGFSHASSPKIWSDAPRLLSCIFRMTWFQIVPPNGQNMSLEITTFLWPLFISLSQYGHFKAKELKEQDFGLTKTSNNE